MPAPAWRFGRGWTESELEPTMAALGARPSTAPAAASRSRYHSHAIIAIEPAGPPLPGGPFTRARELVTRYEFSDPRIVAAHFDPTRPLLGRLMLLEIKVLGLRYLNPVVISEVRDQPGTQQSHWGFRYDTLEGHLESGWEWFLLTKDHASGAISFRIEASWCEGQFPNWWTRVGFHWFARRYQRAWHRLAYLRLRARLDSDDLPPLPRGAGLIETGTPMSSPGIEMVAGRHPPRHAEIEEVTFERLGS